MIEEILDSPVTPVLTFLIGMIVGHWLTIIRDKRKEYNELVAPLRKEISAEASRPSIHRMAIGRDDMDALCARINCFMKLKLIEACERYWNSKERQDYDEIGQPFHPDEEAIRQAANKLLDTIPYR